MSDLGREGARRRLAIQPAVHPLLLRYEAPERLQRDGDRAEARSARERPHSLPVAREPRAAAPDRLSLRRRVFQVVQLLRPGRGEMNLVAIGNWVFRVRNYLFPIAVALAFLPGPTLFSN